jgi:hypothetical protein
MRLKNRGRECPIASAEPLTTRNVVTPDLTQFGVAVGDAENDHAFLRACGCAAAVANALPMLKETADIRLAGARGAGVAELVELICRDDARIIPPERHGLAVGALRDGRSAFTPRQAVANSHGTVMRVRG